MPTLHALQINMLLLLIGRVALFRDVAAYSHQTSQWTICRSVRRSVQCIVENGESDPDAVWHHRSDGSKDEAGIKVWDRSTGRGTFWGEFGARHCN